jgi:hypothetical protein
MKTQREPFSSIEVGQRIRFDNGYYMTGHITKNVGTHSGKRMVHFFNEEWQKEMIVSYAAHRSVVMMPECLCCDFGAHDMTCDCDGKNCCHPENH